MRVVYLSPLVSAFVAVGCSQPASEPSRGAVPNQATANKSIDERGSSIRLSPYLLFDGNCKEAMEFYQSALGGELSLTKVGDSPMKDAFPVQLHGRVVNARLKSPFVDISASDWLRPAEKRVNGNTVCLYLSGGTPEETKAVFRKLSEEADVTDPISDQPYGLYGALNDRFGVRWMFHAENK